jgi:N-acetylmuramoyl-L-alanine amidase
MQNVTILGKATRRAKDLNAWLASKNCPQYAEFYLAAGEEFGVRGDMALFQSCLETGWFWNNEGPFDVKEEQHNYAGLGATGGGVPGDSFLDPLTGIRAQCQDLALRCDTFLPKESIISPYAKKQYATISTRHSKTYEDLSGTWAADKTYHQQIYRIASSFDALYPSQTTPKKATWVNVCDKGYCVQAMNDGDVVDTLLGNSVAQLKAFLEEHSTAGTWLVGPQKGMPKPPLGKRVLLDPGHCEGKVGARGKNSSVQEEDLNRFQAEVLKAELESLGVSADIYDPVVDDLIAIGKKAQGYDAFVSLHLNAYDGREHYTCSMCHATLQSASSKAAKVASAWSQTIASAIGHPCFEGSSGWPKGVMAAGLSVLNGASQTDCPVFFLSELEFCDDETNPDGIKERIRTGLKAGAKVLADSI